jgi:hypothetical protein
MTALFVDSNKLSRSSFELPTPKQKGKPRAYYPQSYPLKLLKVSHENLLVEVGVDEAFAKFPRRNGNIGLRCYSAERISYDSAPWSNDDVVRDLFWFEYARYYFQINYLMSNSDLDMFVIGSSGAAYAVELKSKSPSIDKSFGDWFGIDMGPFAKLAFFTQNTTNNDALYIVEEVDPAQGAHVEWLGIRFRQLVQVCSWVGRVGGRGMTGGASATYTEAGVYPA